MPFPFWLVLDVRPLFWLLAPFLWFLAVGVAVPWVLSPGGARCSLASLIVDAAYVAGSALYLLCVSVRIGARPFDDYEITNDSYDMARASLGDLRGFETNAITDLKWFCGSAGWFA